MKLLAVCLVYLALTIHATTADFQSACMAVDVDSREACGSPVITADACRAQQCCFNDTRGDIFCFKAPGDFQGACMAVELGSRVDCGYPGITADECRAQQCCFDDTREGKWCFISPEDGDDCASSPCQNFGQCTDGIYSVNCTCLDGFNGTYCEIYDPCGRNPCQNGGQCVASGILYKCTCQPGFTGTDCETDIDECASNPCKNGSWCENLLNMYKCNCMNGFTGTDCDADLDECRSAPCQNNGTCVNEFNSYTCLCPSGYVDVNCQTVCKPILVQQNLDGSNFFNRTWQEFKVGFGNATGNYWIGNEELHQLTKSNQYKLKFDLQSLDNGQWYWAEYSTFIIGDECSEYTLQVGGFSGNVAYDAMSDPAFNSLNGMRFTTKDRDNDQRADNCAVLNNGGFWYTSCSYCGVNVQRGSFDDFSWNYLYTGSQALQASRMRLMCR